MVSTDIDGSPILVLSLEDARRIKDHLDHPLSANHDDAWFKAYKKITRFVEDCGEETDLP